MSIRERPLRSAIPSPAKDSDLSTAVRCWAPRSPLPASPSSQCSSTPIDAVGAFVTGSTVPLSSLVCLCARATRAASCIQCGIHRSGWALCCLSSCRRVSPSGIRVPTGPFVVVFSRSDPAPSMHLIGASRPLRAWRSEWPTGQTVRAVPPVGGLESLSCSVDPEQAHSRRAWIALPTGWESG